MNLANTGSVSFILYGIFIVITLIALGASYKLILKQDYDVGKVTTFIELFKYSIVSVAIATVTLIVTNLFKEREQDVKELEYFDKYVEDVKKADGIQERYLLSKYLSIVAPRGELQRSWKEYFDSVKIEYHEYQLLKKEKIILDSVKKPTLEQNIQKELIEKEIKQKESPLIAPKIVVTYAKDYKEASKWEEKGFDFLLKKDVNNAIMSFTESENVYNQFHQVYEISKYLKSKQKELLNPSSKAWNEAYRKIISDFSWEMPDEHRSKIMKEISLIHYKSSLRVC